MRTHLLRILTASLGLTLAGLLIGCPPAAKKSARSPDTSESAPPPPIRVDDSREGLIFSFLQKADGTFATAESIPDVPVAARKSVVVTDLTLSPEKRQAGRYIYLADLTAKRSDGTYPVSLASRYAFEAELSGTSTAPGSAGASGGVVLYSTSWCGACKQAKRFLKSKGVAFTEKDVEASRSAQQELASKAAALGIQTRGVPVIDVKGQLLQGFDARTLESTLKQKGLL